MAEAEQPLAVAEPATEADDADTPGLLLSGIVGARGHERALSKVAASENGQLVRHEGLAALVHQVPYRLPAWEPDRIRQHSRTVERAMRRCTIVPAPYGIVFRGEDQVRDFLAEQQIALQEALSFLDGAFEMRLHIHPSGRRPGTTEQQQADQAAQFYTALRRRARAALPLPPGDERILSAAFLVDRVQWVTFVEHTDELDADNPGFRFDLTGPWPPYDFVRMVFMPRESPEA